MLKLTSEVTALNRLIRTGKGFQLIGALTVLLTVVLLSGCQLALPQSTLNPAGDVAKSQQDLFILIFVISVIIFIGVQGFLIIAVLKYRARRGRENDIPPQTHGNTPLEIGWTIAPAILVIAITIPTVAGIGATYDPPDSYADDPAMTIEVVGHQWWWEYRYLDENGDLDFITANELHIPIDTVINLKLSSKDVIHSFSIPRLAGSRDAVPGHVNRMWFNATETGVYAGQCKEFCGDSHALMRTVAFAREQADYEAWAANERQPAVNMTPAMEPGWTVFKENACRGCHTIEGATEDEYPIAIGVTGPKLSHFGSRVTIAANTLHKGPADMTMGAFFENVPTDPDFMQRDPESENLRRWLNNAQDVKPGTEMPDLDLTEQQLDDLVFFLESLK